MDKDRLQELKEKYVSVLSVLNRKNFQVQNIHLENDKLLIRATAPDNDAKNAFWDAVKTVSKDYNKDFTGDISLKAAPQPTAKAQVREQAPAPTAQVIPAAGKAAATEQTYTVVAGDTLSKIAKRFYGNPNEYMRIFNANKDQLKDPDKIFPNQVLKIPRTSEPI